MIIVKLMGGLGNQMFQYAVGRSLSIKYNTELRLDHSFLEDRTPRKDFTYRDYELNAFGIDAKISQEEIKRLGLNNVSNIVPKIVSKSKRVINGYKKINETTFNYDSSIENNGPNMYLSGYFQNEKYFLKSKQIIREDFTFIPYSSAENKELSQQILNLGNPVALHVRRGDYLTLAGGTFHNICSVQYYAEAVKIIQSKIKNPTFFVFSADDPQWARDNLKIGVPFEVIGEKNVGVFGFENMRLMSLCKHNIIANSSFSWWGAWLNHNQEKIVIAPKVWFADEEKQKQSEHLIPAGWIRL